MRARVRNGEDEGDNQKADYDDIVMMRNDADDGRW